MHRDSTKTLSSTGKMLPFGVTNSSRIARWCPPLAFCIIAHASGWRVAVPLPARRGGDAGTDAGASAGTHAVRTSRGFYGTLGHAPRCRHSSSRGKSRSQPGDSNGDSISSAVHEEHGPRGTAVCGRGNPGHVCRSSAGHQRRVPKGRMDLAGRGGCVRSLCEHLRSRAGRTVAIIHSRQYASGAF